MNRAQTAYVVEFDRALTERLTHDLDLFERIYRRFCNRIAENIVAGGEVSPGTPVDTGFARASWWSSLNEFGSPHQPENNPQKGKAWDGDADLTALASVTLDDTAYILSNCAYIRALEEGWSGQAPNGFIQLTVATADVVMQQILGDFGLAA